MWSFPISSMFLGLLDQLQIISQLYLTEAEASRAVALDISKVFDRIWHAGLLHERTSYAISGQVLGLISSFLSNRQLRVVLDGKTLQEYPVNTGVPLGYIISPTPFLLYINDLANDVICHIAIYADDTTLCYK